MIMASSEDIEAEIQREEEVAGFNEENQEEDCDTEISNGEKENIKQMRKQIRARITRSMTRIKDTMKRNCLTKRRSDKELLDIRKDFDKALNLNGEMYRFDECPSARLNKSEAGLCDDMYSIEEKVKDYIRDMSKKQSVETRSVTRTHNQRSSIEDAGRHC